MAPPSIEWPVLATSRENSATKHNRFMNVYYDVTRFIEVIEQRSDHRIPKPLQELLRNIQNAVDDLLKDPLDMGWVNVTTSLQAGISTILKEITTTKNTPQPTSARVRTYADATRGAPPPAHYRSSHDSGSSRGATPSDLDQDRDVIVKLSAQSTQQYRKYKSPDILKKVNRAFREASKAAGSPALASVSLLAARQLKSGDLSLRLGSAAQAEVARRHQGWATGIDKAAKVRVPTWGVVADGVPVKAMDLPGNMPAIINQLTNDNTSQWGPDCGINHVGWLTKAAAGKKETSIVVEFMNPQAANRAIDLGIIWDATVLRTRIYDRSARIKQCYNCQKYGHIGSTCSNRTACAHCAESHQTRDCPRKQAGDTSRKCANCGGAHAAWAKACLHFQSELARVEAAGASRERYHRVPAYLSPGPVASSNSKATASDSQASEPGLAASGSKSSSGEAPRSRASTGARPQPQVRSSTRGKQVVRRPATPDLDLEPSRGDEPYQEPASKRRARAIRSTESIQTDDMETDLPGRVSGSRGGSGTNPARIPAGEEAAQPLLQLTAPPNAEVATNMPRKELRERTVVIYKDPATSDIQTEPGRSRSGARSASRKARSSTSTRRGNDQGKVDRILRSKSTRRSEDEDDELAEAIGSSQSSALITQSTILADRDLNGSTRKRTAEQARIGQDKAPRGVESRPVRIPTTRNRALIVSNDQ